MKSKLIEAMTSLASCVAILALEIDNMGVMPESVALDFNRNFAAYEKAVLELDPTNEEE